jgi:uncharacterized protein (DUF697 family)
MPKKLNAGSVIGLVRELAASRNPGHLAIAGPAALTETLRRDLARDADPGAVRVGTHHGAAVLLYVLAAPPTEDDLAALKSADKARVPIVAVLAGPALDDRVPYVLATDVVRTEAGAGFDLTEIARVVAGKLVEDGAPLAARLPVLRNAVVESLVERFARVNGTVGALVFVPGADLPVITLNQIRLVLRIAHAHGIGVGQERAPEVVAVLGSGFALRALARQLAGIVPVAGWAVKAGVAYGGTRAIGEAAKVYYGAQAESVRSGS